MQNEFTIKEIEAIRHIRNYLMNNGTFPSVRDLMKELGYKSPRSAAIIVNSLISKGVLSKKVDGSIQLVFDKETIKGESHAETINIPLVGSVACGLPIYAKENIEAFIPVSIKLAKPSNKYFILLAKGDSMNERGINDGDLVLIRQANMAENGENVVALIDDEATIKEFHHKGETIVLMPRSTNKKHQPIILTNDFRIQGIVVTVIPKIE